MNPYEPTVSAAPEKRTKYSRLFVDWLNPLEKMIAIITAVVFIAMALFVIGISLYAVVAVVVDAH
ncbi:hypothetical protein FYK55_03700 [Roseiconus nitratireducens]|uniref:Uncharacterized protein n=1 Tax=Roseiconus nitratireducens TaxID=2605748 RepID=A0A5M6DIH9_9BACT|nr:hypothetical protein [Roseiconus nitratireducens]KAA5546022.1 hypothetical protein FYK55_03700 [Roseiconus nitratireducens]